MFFKFPSSTSKDDLPPNKSGGGEAPDYKESRFYIDVDGNYAFGDTSVCPWALTCRSVPISPYLV